MKRKTYLLAAVLVAVVFSAYSCGGGGSSGQSAAGGPGASRGAITGFGSVIVNGIEFDTTGAVFTVENLSSPVQSDLDEGMEVTVEGEFSGDGLTGTATQVIFNDDLEGPVDTISGNTIIVMGQSVLTDNDTIFANAPAKLGSLSAGDIVEVSGPRGSNGVILATRVEKKGPFTPGVDELEILGTVSNLVSTANTMEFSISALTVDFSSAVLQDFGSGGPTNGDLVEVKSATLPAGGVLTATRVELKNNDVPGVDNDEIEIEGLVDRFVDISDFDVDGQAVDASGSGVEFFNGVADDVDFNVKLEVEGDLLGGVIIARKVKFRGNRIKIEATVDTGGVNPGAGTVTLMNIVVSVNQLTETKDNTSASADLSDLNNISAGDALRIRGFVSSGVVTATRLERDNTIDLDKFILQGPVDSIGVEPLASRTFVIAGVTIDTQNTADANFEQEGSIIGRSVFFANLLVNSQVKARGIYNGSTTIDANQVELQD